MFTLLAVNVAENEAENAALEAAIAAVGGKPGELARLLGVDPQVVTNWRKRGVPPGRVIAVEQAVRGAVTRYELRPEIYGAKPDGWLSPFAGEEQAA